MLHQANPEPMTEDAKRQDRDFRKKLNQDARKLVTQSIHKGVKLIVPGRITVWSINGNMTV